VVGGLIFMGMIEEKDLYNQTFVMPGGKQVKATT